MADAGRKTQSAAAESELAAELAAGVDMDRLMAHMREFSQRVKLSGTPDELESFQYLKSRMESFGYKASLLSHDAYISLPGKASVEISGQRLDCITHSMSKASGPAGVLGELIYVGEGDAASIAAADVGGRILLVDGIATEEVAAAASKSGAVGQIHISPNQHLYEMCVSPVWGSPSQHTRNALPSTIICTTANEPGAILRKRCLAGETISATMFAEVDTGWRKTPLLVAELNAPAAAPDAPFVLFSGHHDTWHFGVMDNGGANATMLEAARLLASRRSSWARGLRVCFWSGHSHGRYSGSAWYADECWNELEQRCAAHVNVDSTGGAGAGVLTNSGVVDELRHVAADAIFAETGQVHAGRRHGRVADQSFWGVGVPSMFGSLSHQPPGPFKAPTALGWWWHTPHDLIDHIDPKNLVRDTRIVVRVLCSLLTERVLPLDYRIYCAALDAEIARWRNAVGRHLALGALEAAASALGEASRDIAALGRDVPEDRAERINTAMMRASRHLVALNYTSGDRFRHDPALPAPAWFSLQGLRELAELDPASPDRPFFVVHARQSRNRAVHFLKQAEASLRSALSPIES